MALLKRFVPIESKEFETQRLNDNIRDFADQLKSNPLLDGRLIEGVVVTTSGIDVEHKLSRDIQGWIVTDKNADARVWSTGSSNRFLSLDSSATVTIDIWVF